MTAEPDRLGIGGNDPPKSLEDELSDRNGQLIDRLGELTKAFTRVPERLRDDDECGKAQDLFAMMRTAINRAEDARKTEGEPFRVGKATVDAFFNTPADDLKRRQQTLNARISAYLRDKADRERREREDRARAEAAEAERQRQIAAEAQRKADADAAEGRAKSAAKAAEVARVAADRADAADARSGSIAASIEHTPSLSRTRSTIGTVGSLSTRWIVKSVDVRTVPLDELRPYLNAEAVKVALNGWLRAHKNDPGGPRLAGVEFEEKDDARVRG